MNGYFKYLDPKIPDNVDWDIKFKPEDLWCPKLKDQLIEMLSERLSAAGQGVFNPFIISSPYKYLNLQTGLVRLLAFYASSICDGQYAHIRKIDTTDYSGGGQVYNPIIKSTDANNQDPGNQFPFNDATTAQFFPNQIRTWRDHWWEICKLRRAYPLSIFKTNDQAKGKSGRARFEATTDNAYGDSIWLPATNPPQQGQLTEDNTPLDQRKLSGKYFDGAPGSWSESEDQIAQPATIYSQGFAARKDYIGPWILEDVRDALKKLTTTFGYSSTYLGTPIGFFRGSNPGGYFTNNDAGVAHNNLMQTILAQSAPFQTSLIMWDQLVSGNPMVGFSFTATPGNTDKLYWPPLKETPGVDYGPDAVYQNKSIPFDCIFDPATPEINRRITYYHYNLDSKRWAKVKTYETTKNISTCILPVNRYSYFSTGTNRPPFSVDGELDYGNVISGTNQLLMKCEWNVAGGFKYQ